MKDSLFEKIIGVGLFIIVLVFNPFVFAGMYIDSTGAYSFIASSKIYILAALNTILLIVWGLKVKSAKELNITPSKVYLPVFLWLGSAILSYFLSVNKLNSMFGYNFTLENSLIECAMLVIFFIIFINNILTKESLETVIRFFLSGVSVSFIYLIIRYSSNQLIANDLFKDYFNSTSFALTGNVSSIPVLAIAASILGIGLTVSDLSYGRKQMSLLIDALNTIIAISMTFILMNLGNDSKDFILLTAFVISAAIILYIIFTNKKLQQSFIPVLGLIGISAIIGLGLHFGVTKNIAQPQAVPAVTLNETWNITLDSLKEPATRGFWGNGESNFAYFFDRLKSESTAIPQVVDQTVITNFVINAQSPNVEEIRVFQPGSYVLGVLFSQGIIGLLSFISIFVVTISSALKKDVLSKNIMAYISFIALLAIIGFIIFVRYDFIILLLIWLTLGIHLISTNEGEPQTNLVISFSGKSFEFNHNYNFAIPLFMLVFTAGVLITCFKIFPGNYYLYSAKQAQIKQNLGDYQKNSATALLYLDQSDLVAREYVYSNGISIIQKYQDIQKKAESDTTYRTSDQRSTDINRVHSDLQSVVGVMDNAISLYPLEYKNYFLNGFLISRASETFDQAYDSSTERYLVNSRSANLYHPETLYELGKLYYRNKDYTNASLNIQSAVLYRPDNLYYQTLKADTLKAVGSYQQALQIYTQLQKIRDTNQNNASFQQFYKDQLIDQKITDTNTKITQSQKPTPTTTPTSTPTVTPTVKK